MSEFKNGAMMNSCFNCRYGKCKIGNQGNPCYECTFISKKGFEYWKPDRNPFWSTLFKRIFKN